MSVDNKYIWHINPKFSLKCTAKNIEIARKEILNEINKLCLDHEKASNYIKYTKANTDLYYVISEYQFREKLCTLLCLVNNINSHQANWQIDECYKYKDYSIFINSINKLLTEKIPIIQSEI
jgi:hypothetical protein